jgi:hypothetical protein
MIPRTALGFGQETIILWSIETSVGLNAQNSNSEDISYVQFYYTLAAKDIRFSQDRRDVYAQVSVTGQCDGTDNDPLVNAIWIDEQALNHPFKDSKLSVVQNPEGMIPPGENTAWMILRLGARFCSMYPDIWPRIDKIPGCPEAIKQAVLRAIIRVPDGNF